MREIPVFLFVGFMDSGKTTFINATLHNPEFTQDSKTLLICCEEGELEYDLPEMERLGVSVVVLEDEEELNPDTLKMLRSKYKPDQIVIEFNGTWNIERLLSMQAPRSFVVVQIIATVNGETFEMYMANMRTMIMSQVARADDVFFNRCKDGMDISRYGSAVKAMNRRAQILFEFEDETLVPYKQELNIDLTQPVIEISDIDYGNWYIDAMENPEKYDGKVVSFLGVIYNPKKMQKDLFGVGRTSMVCCADDTRFFGFACTADPDKKKPTHGTWVTMKAKMHKKFVESEQEYTVILEPLKMLPAKEPEDGMIYFN